MNWRMAQGATFEEAVASLLKSLGADESEVEIENLGESRKLFGLGGPVIKVRGRLKEDAVRGEPREKTERVRTEPKNTTPMTESEIEEIAEKASLFLQSIIENMNLPKYKITITVEKTEVTLVINDHDEPFAVGRNGEVLEAIQTLLGIYIGRLHEGRARITVDAGNYRENRLESLKTIAEKAAAEALAKGKKVYLGPMKSSDRKVVHAALQENADVQTKSQGEGDRRQVVVYPAKSNK
ncbi:MAG: hypothetical protein HY280_04710 [Nitrospinae bacterium]|nr:hypothetical protein [Nitrospinota bacterium]